MGAGEMGEERGFGNNEDGVEAGKTHGLGIEEEGKHVGGGGKETWWQQTHTGGGGETRGSGETRGGHY